MRLLPARYEGSLGGVLLMVSVIPQTRGKVGYDDPRGTRMHQIRASSGCGGCKQRCNGCGCGLCPQQSHPNNSEF